MTSVRVQKNQLRKKIASVIQQEEDLENEINDLKNQVLEKQKQIDKLWQNDVKLFQQCYNRLTNGRMFGNHDYEFRNYNQAILELVYERLVKLNNTTLNKNEKMIYGHNIKEIEDYINDGCPRPKLNNGYYVGC